MGDIVNIDAIDAQKPNDSIAQTSLLNRDSGTVQNLTIHNATDLDYYQVILPDKGTSQNFIKIAYDASLGELAFDLYDAQNRLGSPPQAQRMERTSASKIWLPEPTTPESAA